MLKYVIVLKQPVDISVTVFCNPTKLTNYLQVHTRIIDESENFRQRAISGRSIRRSLHFSCTNFFSSTCAISILFYFEIIINHYIIKYRTSNFVRSWIVCIGRFALDFSMIQISGSLNLLRESQVLLKNSNLFQVLRLNVGLLFKV